LKGKLGEPAYLEEWVTTATPLTAGEAAFKVTFDWDEEIGVPGAFLIRNNHLSEFYLKTVTLEGVPGHGRVHFVCNSWIYPAKRYNKDRVFFTNQVIIK
jgi:linoleate 9S-lipoxygenase